MNLRDALNVQGPSLEMHRAARNEIARLDYLVKELQLQSDRHRAEAQRFYNALGDGALRDEYKLIYGPKP